MIQPKPNRRSIRLKGYNYSQEGMYFVTICCQDRACRFGRVDNGKMILNDQGRMIDRWIREIPNKFKDIQVHEYVIMPNHIHIIWVNIGVGADPCVGPNNISGDNNNLMIGEYIGEHIGSPQQGSPQQGSPQQGSPQQGSPQQGSPQQGSPQQGTSLYSVVQWFKTMTTNEYIRGVKNLGWQPFNKKIWQRDYYEHIIRNERAYQNISHYIRNNPLNWGEDKFLQ